MGLDLNYGNNTSAQVGVYYGKVVDVFDPEKRGRIRVRTPHFITAPIESIPWAEYCAPGNGGSADTGFYFIPNIGSQVVVAFVQGSIEYPVWMGAVPGTEGSQADTHVAHMDPLAPYDGIPIGTEELPLWEETLVNTITTIQGHRIVLDDNQPRPNQQTSDIINVRRIVVESSIGHFLRIVEDQDLNAIPKGSELPAFELGTVRPDDPERGYIRRLRLDHKAQNITLTGPDAVDDGQHELEINSVDDFISFTTSNQYKFIMDDANELIDLYTTRPSGGQNIGNQMVFNNPNRTIDIKSYQDVGGINVWDPDDADGKRIDMYMPYDTPHGQRNADIGIKHGDGSYMVAGDGMSQNGFKADWTGDRVIMWSQETGGQATGGNLVAGTPRVEVGVVDTGTGPESTRVYAGNSNHYLDIKPFEVELAHNTNRTRVYGAAQMVVESNVMVDINAPLINVNGILNMQSGSVSLYEGSTGTGPSATGTGTLSLSCSELIMMTTAGTTISHDYFKHTHTINFDSYPSSYDPTPVTTPIYGAYVSGVGSVQGKVRTSYPAPEF